MSGITHLHKKSSNSTIELQLDSSKKYSRMKITSILINSSYKNIRSGKNILKLTTDSQDFTFTIPEGFYTNIEQVNDVIKSVVTHTFDATPVYFQFTVDNNSETVSWQMLRIADDVDITDAGGIVINSYAAGADVENIITSPNGKVNIHYLKFVKIRCYQLTDSADGVITINGLNNFNTINEMVTDSKKLEFDVKNKNYFKFQILHSDDIILDSYDEEDFHMMFQLS